MLLAILVWTPTKLHCSGGSGVLEQNGRLVGLADCRKKFPASVNLDVN